MHDMKGRLYDFRYKSLENHSDQGHVERDENIFLRKMKLMKDSLFIFKAEMQTEQHVTL